MLLGSRGTPRFRFRTIFKGLILVFLGEEPAEVQLCDTPAQVACLLLPGTEKASPRAEKHLWHL